MREVVAEISVEHDVGKRNDRRFYLGRCSDKISLHRVCPVCRISRGIPARYKSRYLKDDGNYILSPIIFVLMHAAFELMHLEAPSQTQRNGWLCQCEWALGWAGGFRVSFINFLDLDLSFTP